MAHGIARLSTYKNDLSAQRLTTLMLGNGCQSAHPPADSRPLVRGENDSKVILIQCMDHQKISADCQRFTASHQAPSAYAVARSSASFSRSHCATEKPNCLKKTF